MDEIKDLEITDIEVKKAEAIVITDQAGMIAVKNMIDAIRAKVKKIDDHYDRVDEHGKKVGQWRDIKTALDNTKKVWDGLVATGKKILAILDQKQKEFIRSEDKKKEEQEASIRASLLEQAEEQKQEQVIDLILEGKTEEAEAVKAQEVKAPIVNLKTDAIIFGQSRRKNWKYRIIDRSKIPDEFMMKVPDDEKIMREIKKLEGNTRIPGIEAYDDFSIIRKR